MCGFALSGALDATMPLNARTRTVMPTAPKVMRLLIDVLPSWVATEPLAAGQPVAYQPDVDLERVESLRETKGHTQLVGASLQGLEAWDDVGTRRSGAARLQLGLE